MTAAIPKCLLQVGSGTLLSHALRSFNNSGISEVWVATGHCADRLTAVHPYTIYNPHFESDNILGTFYEARSIWEVGALCSYGDILVDHRMFTSLSQSNSDLTLVLDTTWRNRYTGRVQHPESEAELARVGPAGTIVEVAKGLDPESTAGEFVGLFQIRESIAGKASRILQDLIKTSYSITWRSKYLSHFFTHLASIGIAIEPLYCSYPWIEIDTPEDLARATDGI